MQLATLASPVRVIPGRFSGFPSWLEALAVAGAIALLLPAFAQVAEFGDGRDRRFAEAGSRFEDLAAPPSEASVRPDALRPQQRDGGDLRALADATAATAALSAEARQSTVRAHKNEAMRELMQSAGWQWAGAMLLGYALMRASRRRMDPGLGVALSLAVWAAAAWVSRVPWPFAGSRGFEPGRPLRSDLCHISPAHR